MIVIVLFIFWNLSELMSGTNYPHNHTIKPGAVVVDFVWVRFIINKTFFFMLMHAFDPHEVLRLCSQIFSLLNIKVACNHHVLMSQSSDC